VVIKNAWHIITHCQSLYLPHEIFLLYKIITIHERYDQMATHYDLIVVGAGPAGLMAAKTVIRTRFFLSQMPHGVKRLR